VHTSSIAFRLQNQVSTTFGRRPAAGTRRRRKNEDWFNSHDPEAEITRMKGGPIALAYTVEHVVDMDSGAIVAGTIHGNTVSVAETSGTRLITTAVRSSFCLLPLEKARIEL